MFRHTRATLVILLPGLLVCAALWLAVACGDGATVADKVTHERIREVGDKYWPLFLRQPTYHSVVADFMRDENGERTGMRGFVVYVTEKVDQRTLPPEDRIPDCLEGVPVQIIEQENTDEYASSPRVDGDKEEANGSA